MPGNYIFNYEYTFNYELYYSGLITDWDLIQLFYYSFFLTFSDHPRENSYFSEEIPCASKYILTKNDIAREALRR